MLYPSYTYMQWARTIASRGNQTPHRMNGASGVDRRKISARQMRRICAAPAMLFTYIGQACQTTKVGNVCTDSLWQSPHDFGHHVYKSRSREDE
jgi:hypothetical protein